MTTKGNAPGVSLGCEISASHPALGVAFAPPVPFLIGHTDGATLQAHLQGGPEEVVLFREKVAHSEPETTMRHDCTLRHIDSSSGPGPVPQLESTGHVVYQNGSPLASPPVPVPLGTVAWPTNVLNLPAPVISPFGFPGRYVVGKDATSERIKSFIPFNGALAASDVMSCEDTLGLAGGDTPVVVLQRPVAEDVRGMWLRPGAQPTQ